MQMRNTTREKGYRNRTVPKAPSTIGTTLVFTSHILLNSLARFFFINIIIPVVVVVVVVAVAVIVIVIVIVIIISILLLFALAR